jgi:hypothetical protein
VTVTVSGGRRWEAALREIEKVAGNMHARAGILESATYSTGDPSYEGLTPALTAYWHEFGRGNNPERSFIRRAKSERMEAWMTQLKIGMRTSAAALISAPTTALGNLLKSLGEIVAQDIREYVNHADLAPLTERTIREKREGRTFHGLRGLFRYTSNAKIPLARTGQMTESIDSELRDSPAPESSMP